MTRKEQEMLAVLGLLISLYFVGLTFYYRFTDGQSEKIITETLIEKSNNEELVSELSLEEKEFQEKIAQAKKEAVEYGDLIVNALVKRPRFDFVYNQFSEATKREFNNNQHEFRLALERLFGRLGQASRVELTYQEADDLGSSAVQVKNRYLITYPRLGRGEQHEPRILDMIVLIDEDRYTLYMLDFKLLRNVGRGE